jgi:hypothetical protein
MQKLKQLYRSNYAGETIVTTMTLSNSEWTPETEYIANSVFNTFTTTQAIAIANGESRANFDLRFISGHKAGLGGENSLQSYGCNALYRNFAPDFLVATGDDIVEEIAKSTYPSEHIVYANAPYLLDYPGKFYLIPQNIHWDAGSLAVYLACFDGHKKIFMMGYDGYDMAGKVNNIYKNTNGYLPESEHQNHDIWIKALHIIMTTYSDVEFIRIVPAKTYSVPESLSGLVNFRQIDYRDFVLEADIGFIS